MKPEKLLESSHELRAACHQLGAALDYGARVGEVLRAAYSHGIEEGVPAQFEHAIRSLGG